MIPLKSQRTLSHLPTKSILMRSTRTTTHFLHLDPTLNQLDRRHKVCIWVHLLLVELIKSTKTEIWAFLKCWVSLRKSLESSLNWSDMQEWEVSTTLEKRAMWRTQFDACVWMRKALRMMLLCFEIYATLQSISIDTAENSKIEFLKVNGTEKDASI